MDFYCIYVPLFDTIIVIINERIYEDVVMLPLNRT